MFYRAVAATCPGNEKEYNSHNIYLNTKYITDELKFSEILLKQKKEQEGLQFYAISEGFGADRYADEASLIAVKKLLSMQEKVSGNSISDEYDKAADALYSYLEEYVKSANEAVNAKSSELPENTIHASLAALAIYENAVITCNLGNTRIYLFRKGHISRLTEDHNQAQVMFKNGVISEDKLVGSPKFNKLTQYLGMHEEERQLEPYYSEVEVKHGDIFVICSSSYYKNVSDNDICTMIKESKSLTQIAEKLMRAAAAGGFNDDTSVLVLRADSHERAAAAPITAGAAAARASSNAVKTSMKSANVNDTSPIRNERSSEYTQEYEDDTEDLTVMDKIKRLLGLNKDAESETIWPALLTFLCCIIVVIVLGVLGWKIYNVSKAPAGRTPAASASVSPSAPTSSATDIVTETPSGQPSETPTVAAGTQTPTLTPTPTPTVTPDNSTPTVTPDNSTPTITPDDPTPTVTPDNSTPTVTPDDPTPTITPDDPTPTITPDDPTPTITPDDPTPTVTPDDPTPTVTPDDPTPTMPPEDPTPTITPDDSTPTVTPEDPTTTITPDDPAPTVIPEGPTADPTPESSET